MRTSRWTIVTTALWLASSQSGQVVAEPGPLHDPAYRLKAEFRHSSDYQLHTSPALEAQSTQSARKDQDRPTPAASVQAYEAEPDYKLSSDFPAYAAVSHAAQAASAAVPASSEQQRPAAFNPAPVLQLRLSPLDQCYSVYNDSVQSITVLPASASDAPGSPGESFGGTVLWTDRNTGTARLPAGYYMPGGNSRLGKSRQFQFAVSRVAAVPEIEASLMLLAGFTLLGWIGRRQVGL